MTVSKENLSEEVTLKPRPPRMKKPAMQWNHARMFQAEGS